MTKYSCHQKQRTPQSPPQLIPVRCELISPDTDWTSAWRLVRTRGLSSTLSSFLFKLLHLLLPIQARAQRLGADRYQAGGRCLQCGEENEDLQHCFFSCPANQLAGLATLGWAQTLAPGLSQANPSWILMVKWPLLVSWEQGSTFYGRRG